MSLLNVGSRALMANQIALQTTGHNIANVNTAGYSRQSVAFQTSPGQNMGSGYIGNGVDVNTILRNFNELLNRQAATASAVSAADSARATSLAQMQEVFSGGKTGLGAAITDMMNSFGDVAGAPTDPSARQVALTRMNELAARFRSASAQLDELDYSAKQQMGNDVTVVNSLAGQVATLNAQISRSIASGQTPNDLLDQRDQLVRNINKYVQTSQIPADDGTISLFVGGSQPLVLGSSSAQLTLKEATEFPGSGKMALYFQQPGGQSVELTPSMLGGGEIAGLLQFQGSDLTEGRNLLGRMALAIGDTLNQQNNLGLTLSGQSGSNLFKLSMVSNGSTTGAQWTGATTPTTTVVDASQLKASDYQVVFGSTAPAGKVIRLSDGKVTDFTDMADLSSKEIDGLRFDLKAEGVQGNSILFRPMAAGAHDIQAAVHSPNDLAVANPVAASIKSLGDATLQMGGIQVSAGFDLSIFAGAEVSFSKNAAGQLEYTITPAPAGGIPATGLYTSGQAIQLAPGLQVKITGTPAINGTNSDKVTLGKATDPQYGTAYQRDAGNASSFLALRDSKLFDGSTTLSDGFSTAMAQVGTRTQSAQYAAKLSETIAKNLEADRTAVSGVNLDEEAAKLLQYQQSYQASAKMLQVAQSIFDSVLQTVGR
ncbi:flagellar hook-associated protein FlgK [Delftia tsuruhatensis]|uniref:Flagellar hook-associated protein 1 n=2 Tax=Pseudomonadota TaxID=1224 RepID=A0A7T3DCU9_9BURK|nr:MULTISPECIES: flagellar hook-associated protein FlgK [Delftia]KAA9181411.1 flagellar hook-associated protein FlgK [Delftia sp. BR1]MPT05090.1 flagellar hook-associated protein FlgK [Delftia sp.]PZP68778.1 MAG: flagellar hook-associated protein FlgK [Delftia acidovorans]EPD36166.1 flagellar hook-associated protein FlgK [Delftia acidovorans CCUG 15835]EPD36408.1 flagellar hook-associated protein FlgK [Delftia acidovorans CCUG 274B]